MTKNLITVLFALISFSCFADNKADSEVLFNWAEQQYPEYFKPSPAETTELDGYLVRYYQETDLYLGTMERDIYVYGQIFGGLLKVGQIDDFLQMTPPSVFDFSTQFLAGKKLYKVDKDDESTTWEILVWEFTESTSTEYSLDNPNDQFTVNYQITDQGYITYNDDNPENDYIKAIEVNDEFIKTVAAYGLANLKYSQSSEEVYFFFDLDKATAFVNTNTQ